MTLYLLTSETSAELSALRSLIWSANEKQKIRQSSKPNNAIVVPRWAFIAAFGSNFSFAFKCSMYFANLHVKKNVFFKSKNQELKQQTNKQTFSMHRKLRLINHRHSSCQCRFALVVSKRCCYYQIKENANKIDQYYSFFRRFSSSFDSLWLSLSILKTSNNTSI